MSSPSIGAKRGASPSIIRTSPICAGPQPSMTRGRSAPARSCATKTPGGRRSGPATRISSFSTRRHRANPPRLSWTQSSRSTTKRAPSKAGRRPHHVDRSRAGSLGHVARRRSVRDAAPWPPGPASAPASNRACDRRRRDFDPRARGRVRRRSLAGGGCGVRCRRPSAGPVRCALVRGDAGRGGRPRDTVPSRGGRAARPTRTIRREPVRLAAADRAAVEASVGIRNPRRRDADGAVPP